MRHDGIGVSVAKTMLSLEPIHNFHVLLVILFLNKFDPVFNGLSVFFFDGWKVRDRSLYFLLCNHVDTRHHSRKQAFCGGDTLYVTSSDKVYKRTIDAIGAVAWEAPLEPFRGKL